MTAHRIFRVVYVFLGLQFVIPAISYMVAPQMTIETLSKINEILGGGPYHGPESGEVWHMLAVGNVMTLGFMCLIMAWDLRRYYPMLPALAFLKGFSSLYSLGPAVVRHLPFFYAIFALDGVTTLAIIFFAVRAHRALVASRPAAV